MPSLCATSGIAATPAHPSAIAVTTASHLGAATQANFSAINATAPAQTMTSVTRCSVPCRLSSPTGVYVPAINR